MPQLLPSHYDYKLVTLSVLIAIFASHAALKLAGRTSASRGKTRAVWIAFGASALGIGIWSMHYIGMLAFSLPVAIFYDVPTVALSFLAAVFASAFALFVVSRDKLTMAHLSVGSLVMGAGIFAMHYVGMAAMRLPASCHYEFWVVAASGAIAVVVSGAALSITFAMRDGSQSRPWKEMASAVVMGFAVAAMHYTGMAAVCYRPVHFWARPVHAVSISSLTIFGLTVATFSILILAVIASSADRYLRFQKNVLHSTETEFRLFKQHSLVCVSRTTFDGRFLEVNDQLVKTLGYDRAEDLVDVNVASHHWHPEDREQILTALKRDGMVNGVEMLMRRKDGKPIWILYNLALCPSRDGQSMGVIANAMDISAAKQQQQELRLAKEQAEAASRAKGQFLANMSHELRTPLNGILGMTSLALECDLSPEVREYLEDSKMSAEALIRIINNVLDYSKIDAQKLELDIHDFNLRTLFYDAIRTVAVSAEQKHIRLKTDFSEPLCETVTGDSGRLRQVVLNLLGNAIKFTDHGEVVLAVRTAPLDGDRARLHVAVRDTGIGISPENLELIFEAFAQADISNTRRYGGTGLGLAISAQLVNAMGGRIWVDSAVGSGSTFHFAVDLGAPASASKLDALTPTLIASGPLTLRV